MRGRRPLGAIPNRMNEDKWFQKIDWLKSPKSGVMKEIRFYGGAFTIIQHWIQFKNEQGETKRFAKLCPGFDFEEAKFYEDRFDRCLLCKHFSDKSLPKWLQSRPKYDYLEDAFDVDAIKDGSRSDVVGVVQINSYGLQDLQDVAASLQKRKDSDLQTVDENARGFSVMWKHNPNASDAKMKQGFSEGDHLSIKFHNKKEQYYLPESDKFDYDGVWGPLTDFLEILTVPSSEEIEEDIRRIKLDEKYEEATGISIFGSSRRSSSSDPKSDWSEDDDAPAEEETPRRTRSREEPADDENWGEDEEPRRTRSRREKSTDDDWKDNEEEASPRRTSQSASSDEDKAPQRRRRREEPAQEAKDEDWGEDDPPPKRTRREKPPADDGDDWGETKSASSADDDWGEDDPPPKRGKSTNGRRRSSKPEEEEEAPPDNKRRVSSGDDGDSDDWEPSPRRTRTSSESDDRPTRPSRRRESRAPSRASDWD